MKASKKRALRAPKAKVIAKTHDLYGRMVKAEGDDRLMAYVALNKAARLIGHRLNHDDITVVTN